jgi:hypothetical protein
MPVLLPRQRPRLDLTQAPSHSTWQSLAGLAAQLERLVAAQKEADLHTTGRRSGAALFLSLQVQRLAGELSRELDKMTDAITVGLLHRELAKQIKDDCR